ncbi:MAG: hypothetical protein DRI94_12850 [Bacteroidetes bacterium]|nr:MAG: hypothetical protein DRI94_12850 [Bacteroidota bacterium]
MIKYFLIIILSTLSLFLKAQNSYDSIPKIFFNIFEQKGSDAAIDYIYATNKYISGNLTANLKVKTELKKVTLMLGKYHGIDIIDTQFISTSYIRLSYLAKFDRQPLKFNFTMYRSDKKWQLQQLRFDDKVSEGFKK